MILSWRVGSRRLWLEALTHVLVLLCLVQYAQQYLLPALLASLMVFVSLRCSIRTRRQEIGYAHQLLFSTEQNRHTHFVDGPSKQVEALKQLILLWRSRYCLVLNMQTESGWRKQWVFSAEMSREEYSHLLRQLCQG